MQHSYFCIFSLQDQSSQCIIEKSIIEDARQNRGIEIFVQWLNTEKNAMHKKQKPFIMSLPSTLLHEDTIFFEFVKTIKSKSSYRSLRVQPLKVTALGQYVVSLD